MAQLMTDLTKLFPKTAVRKTKTADEKRTERVGLAGKRAAKTYGEQPQYGSAVAGLASKIRGETVEPRRELSSIFSSELIKEGLTEEALKIQDKVKKEQREDALATFEVAGFLSKAGNLKASMDLIRREVGTINSGLRVNLKAEDLTDEAQEGLKEVIEGLKELGVNADIETVLGVGKGSWDLPSEAESGIRGPAALLDIYEKAKSIGPLGEGIAEKFEGMLFDSDTSKTTNMRNIQHLVDIGYADDKKEAAKTIYKAGRGLMDRESFMQKGMMNISKVRYSSKQRASAIDDLNDMADTLFPAVDESVSAEGDVQIRFQADPVMEGKVLGKQTENGFEVIENGKLIGYYQ